MFGKIGWVEILIIVVLVIILFGHNKIPGMMKDLAEGVKVFKKEVKTTKSPEKTVKKKTVSKKVVKK